MLSDLTLSDLMLSNLMLSDLGVVDKCLFLSILEGRVGGFEDDPFEI